MKIPKITVPAAKLVLCTGNHGGYREGECLLCGAKGWLSDAPYGVPHGARTNLLTHTRECEMSRLLDNHGRFK